MTSEETYTYSTITCSCTREDMVFIVFIRNEGNEDVFCKELLKDLEKIYYENAQYDKRAERYTFQKHKIPEPIVLEMIKYKLTEYSPHILFNKKLPKTDSASELLAYIDKEIHGY